MSIGGLLPAPHGIPAISCPLNGHETGAAEEAANQPEGAPPIVADPRAVDVPHGEGGQPAGPEPVAAKSDADDDWDDEDFQAAASDAAEDAEAEPEFQHSEQSVGASVSEPATTLPSAEENQESGVEMDFEAEFQDSYSAAPAVESGPGEGVEAMADPREASFEPDFDQFESAAPATESVPATTMAAAAGPQEGSFEPDFEDSTPSVAVTEGDAEGQSLPAAAAPKTADLEADKFNSNAADPAADRQPLEIAQGVEEPQEPSCKPQPEHSEPAAAAASELHPADASPAVAEPQETSFEADFDADFEADFQSAPAREPADRAGLEPHSQVEDSTAFEPDFASGEATAAASEPALQAGPQPTIGEPAVAEPDLEGGQLTADSLSSEVPEIGAQELSPTSLPGTYHMTAIVCAFLL